MKLENDANGVLLGEIKLLRLKDERVLMLTFGTGIGVAICHHGELYRAGGIYHAEMGHMIVDSEGPGCYCNHIGCFESLWSGAAINPARHGDGVTPTLTNCTRGGNRATPRRRRSLRRAERQFANGVWNLIVDREAGHADPGRRADVQVL